MTTGSKALQMPGGRVDALGDWRIARVAGALPNGVVVRLEKPGASLKLMLSPRGSQALMETRFGALSYSAFEGVDAAEAVATARAFGKLLDDGGVPIPSLFPHLTLGATPGPNDRKVVLGLLAGGVRGFLPPANGGASSEPGLPDLHDTVVFDPPGIGELLAPELQVDGAPVAGHVLKAIYLSSTGNRATKDVRNFVLDFASVGSDEDEGGTIVRLRLSAGASDNAFGRVGPLALTILGRTGEIDDESPRATSLASWVLTLLRTKLGPDTDVRLPNTVDDLRALSHPPTRGGPASTRTDPVAAPRPPGTPAPELNLALDADCGQRCVFCSVKSFVKPYDGGDTQLESTLVLLRRAFEQGTDVLRLNGIDPLAYSRVLDVVGEARAIGFRKLAIYSPGRRLADAAFRRALLARAPAEVELSLPLYGVTAAVHDAVVGTPGAYDQVRAALDGWLADAPPGSLEVTTVVVKQNLHEFVAIKEWTASKGIRLSAKAPYPMRQTVRDPYADSAVPVEAIVDAALRQPGVPDLWAAVGQSVMYPCVLFRAESRTTLPVFGAAARTRRGAVLPGTEYRSAEKFTHSDEGGAADAFAVQTVPCPHASACALAPVCPREFYSVYQQLFGLGAFAPVGPYELYGQRPLYNPAKED